MFRVALKNGEKNCQVIAGHCIRRHWHNVRPRWRPWLHSISRDRPEFPPAAGGDVNLVVANLSHFHYEQDSLAPRREAGQCEGHSAGGTPIRRASQQEHCHHQTQYKQRRPSRTRSDTRERPLHVSRWPPGSFRRLSLRLSLRGRPRRATRTFGGFETHTFGSALQGRRGPSRTTSPRIGTSLDVTRDREELPFFVHLAILVKVYRMTFPIRSVSSLSPKAFPRTGVGNSPLRCSRRTGVSRSRKSLASD